jgi:hypothetical protein
VVISTNNGPAYVLHNSTATTNHWLTLNLVGTKSNRDGIGAVVKIGAQSTTVSTSGSYLSSSDKRVHFGLGADAVAERVEIQWPSGMKTVLTKVKADQVLTVREGEN